MTTPEVNQTAVNREPVPEPWSRAPEAAAAREAGEEAVRLLAARAA